MTTGRDQLLGPGEEPSPAGPLGGPGLLGRPGGPASAGLAEAAGREGVASVASVAGLETHSARRPAWKALLVATRPRQWAKNLLVLAAPGAAGVLGRPLPLARTCAALALFVAVSAGTYLLNDVLDVEADRRHPLKRLRPLAAGELSRSTALVAAGLLLAGALAIAPALAGAGLEIVLGAYVGLTLAYSLRLKQIPFLELACISLAFVLRALGGAAAAGVPVSPWFLVVTSAGALLVAAGKRSAEQDLLGAEGAHHRRTLSAYPPWLLRSIRLLAGAVAIVGYLAWALWRGAQADHRVGDGDDLMFVLSALPFALAVGALERLLARGDGGAPEELAFRSRTLQVLGLACLTFLAIGLYS